MAAHQTYLSHFSVTAMRLGDLHTHTPTSIHTMEGQSKKKGGSRLCSFDLRLVEIVLMHTFVCKPISPRGPKVPPENRNHFQPSGVGPIYERRGTIYSWAAGRGGGGAAQHELAELRTL